MKKLIVLVAVLVLIGTASWAQSEMGSGQWLHGIWESFSQPQRNNAGSMNKLWFIGFVSGAAVVMEDAQWIELTGTTVGQWLPVVGKYLDNHPEEWNMKAQISVYRALYAFWPGKVAAPYK